ncbi:DEAD/DEAH box helicase [Defluviitalea saccharophila]|uniref:DEAD/DEAH box helicase n=1 Tax=Defluviitalea saccharophila TaxID=879970 RepID=A0ABZ2YAN6_9FIRM
MGEGKKTVGEWLYEDIEDNAYLIKLYKKLIVQYTNKLQGNKYFLSNLQIKHLLRFADLLSKSANTEKSPFHNNIAQNIVCILEKLYPEHEVNKVFMGSVLSNVNNYVGLMGKCTEYENIDVMERLVESVVKEAYRLPDECGNDRFFDASQSIAFDRIKNQTYYSFSAPTSMGKTFLVKMLIKTFIINKYKYNYVIIVPSKALINEVKSEFINEMGKILYEENYKVITTPTAIKNDNKFNYIMIYTQERLSYQIKINQSMNIDYVFIDEAQKISEIGMRSAYFYKVINYLVKVNSSTRIYFLCPYIPNPDIYLNLIPNIEKKEKEYDIFEFSPVNQHKSIVDILDRRLSVYCDLTREFIDIPIYFNDSEVVDFIYRIGEGSSNIVFCDSKKDVEEYAISYWRKCKEDNNPELKELIEDIKKDIHPKSYLVHFLRKGICCHVGYLPATVKAKIERLFRAKVIKTIFCTSTLLEGVNLPADNLFIIIKDRSYILKEPVNFKNLMGRVGRKTYNLIGNVYIMPASGSTPKTFEKCREIIEKPVESQKLSIDKILDNKLKRKILNSLLNGTCVLDKGNMSYDTFGMARFVINILLKCILEDDSNNYIFKLFNEMLNEKMTNKIKKNFEAKDINDNTNVTIDQLKMLDNAISEGKIKYPNEINYENIKSFLESLYDIFRWDKYENKKEIGKRERLSYYAVLLNQWMLGHSVRRIIDMSIEHHKKIGHFFDDKERRMVEYTGKPAQDNRIVIDCLIAIEDVLLFSISNYFTIFSERYKLIKKVDLIDNDWSEYVDFGTCNKLVIELQKIGFSREVAKIIEKKSYASLAKNNVLHFEKDILNDDSEELVNELLDVKLNYKELFSEEVR